MATKTFKVALSLDNPRIIQSGIDVRSFDKQSIKIAIELTKNSQTYQIPTGAQIKISLLKLARQEQKIILDVPFTSAEAIEWLVPDYLDGYQGEVRVGVYLIAGTENIDVGYFNIASKVSDIDKASEEFTDSVMQGWDQIEADLAEIRDMSTQFEALASDVTSKYNAFDTSVTTAGQTIDDILALQPQFQAVLDETTDKDVISAPEVILARGGAQTLGERLDSDKAEVTAQLAQTKTDLQNELKLRTYKKYGSIDLSQFEGLEHTVDFNLWRDPSDEKIKHDWKLDDSDYEVFYVRRWGASGNDGRTPETAWSRLDMATSKIEADPSIEKAKIIILDVTNRVMNYHKNDITLTKKYIITAEKPVGGNQRITDYSVYAGDVVKGSCPHSVSGVYRIDETDVKGNPLSFKKTNSIADCLAEKNSFYSDGTDIYIHRLDTSEENTIVNLPLSMWQFKLSSTAEVILDNVTLINSSSSQPCHFESSQGTNGNVIVNDVRLLSYVYTSGAGANGISTNGIKDIKLFNCKVFGTPRDGFNYHNTKEINGKGTVLEYNCYAENVGLEGVTANNNISTAHEGIHIVRVGTKGRNSRGPLIADVNGCYSVNIDVEVYGSGLTNMNTYQNSAFCFTDSPATYLPNPDGKAWLINCSGGGKTEYGINCDESFKSPNKIFVDNFMGANIPSDVELTIL